MVRGIRDVKMLNSEDSFTNELHNKVIELNTERYRMNKVDRNYNLYRGTLLDLKDFFLIVLLIFLIENKDKKIAFFPRSRLKKEVQRLNGHNKTSQHKEQSQQKKNQGLSQ